MVKIESTKERGEKNMMEKFSFSLASTMWYMDTTGAVRGDLNLSAADINMGMVVYESLGELHVA